jgi:peptide/nickel transport system permease protein
MNKSVLVLFIFVFIGFAASFLANENPVFVRNDKGWRFSLSDKQQRNWNQLILENKASDKMFIRALIPYTPGKSDIHNSDFISPFDQQFYVDSLGNRQELSWRYRHHLGTDLRGTDVLSGLIHGLRTTFLTGILATVIAAFIAFISGIISGWYAGRGIRMHLITLIFSALTLLMFFIYLRNAFYFPESILLSLVILITLVVFTVLLELKFLNGRNFQIRIPVDAAFTRINELFSTFPRFILILVIGVFIQPSLTQIVLLLGVTGWPDIARVFRSEVLRLREKPFMDAAAISGSGTIRKLFVHLLPNAWPVLSVSILYALALNILMEASLGFLGMGLPASQISLGSMMAQGKDHLSAWWLILFPGVLITVVLFVIFRFAESMRRNA